MERSCASLRAENLFHAGWACCAAAGKLRREARRAEAGDSGNAELASSDSEENGIALGNAPGARGTPLTTTFRPEVYWPYRRQYRTGGCIGGGNAVCIL